MESVIRDAATRDRIDDHEIRITALESHEARIVSLEAAIRRIDKTLGAPPNPFGATEAERLGSGIARAVHETHSERRFWIRLAATVATAISAVVATLGFLRSIGVLK